MYLIIALECMKISMLLTWFIDFTSVSCCVRVCVRDAGVYGFCFFSHPVPPADVNTVYHKKEDSQY